MNVIIDKWRAVPPALRFVATFVAALIVLAVVYPWLSTRFNTQMLAFMSGTAWVVGHVLKLFGQEVVVQGRFLTGPGFGVEVIEECTGAYEVLIFWAAVIAYPVRWRAKLIGVIGGLIVLPAINVVRMVVLFYVGTYKPDWFDLMHTYFWQATLILMITVVWILWIRLVASRFSPKPT